MSETCQTMTDWVAFLTKTEMPVLRKSIEAVGVLRQNFDKVTVRDLSRVVLDDPMMTLKAMSLLQRYRRCSSVSSEVTTFGRVMMMVGILPFFNHFVSLTAIEDLLADDPNALDNVLSVIDRARYASLYAYDFATKRFDIDRYEVQIATELHSMAEIALWCFAPEMMRKIRALALRYRNIRSASLQHHVLGFTFNELQKAMAQAWRLPELLIELMDEKQADNPRVKTVSIAMDLARHTMNGLDDPALPNDYLNICCLLGIEMQDVLVRVAKTRQQVYSVRGEGETDLIAGDGRELPDEGIAQFEQVFSGREREELSSPEETPSDTGKAPT